ncbi:STAS domain-containing protein [Balneatrix alpica]|uniref:Lipid asymmetry maintenance protein MlaB n=1 Tax=Balneatrix alpica TaxID=75684 RepID=A0ABV5ZE67_9GAMM|nr:STAS domain-containing protein [Balneatrix alpica]
MTAATECLQLETVANIAQAEALHELLSSWLEAGVEVRVDASQVERVDTAILQLLLNCQRALNRQGGRILWSGCSEAFIASAMMLGLQQELGLAESAQVDA